MIKKVYAFLFLCLAGITFSNAQTTITVSTPSSYTYLSGSCGVTFVVKNNNSYDVVLTDLSMYRNTASSTASYKLWVSSNSLSGSSTVQPSTWTQIASVTPGTISSSGLHPIFNNLTYIIPANTTLRFCVQSSNRVDYSTSNSNTFTGGGLTMYIGNYQIGGMNVGYAGSGTNISLGNNPRYFHGSITFTPACEGPSNINATNIITTDADISWSPVSGSLGYEYVIDQNPGNPSGPGTATAATTYHAGGLLLNTTYYFHVRNKCTNSFSNWVTYSFTSADAYCKPPVNILYSNLGSTGVDVLWSFMPTADHYQYYYSLSSSIPGPGANIVNTASINTSLTNLLPETQYFFFVRSVCLGGNDSSTWRIDSFTTHKACAAPDVQVQNITSTGANAWWYTVPTAIAYEYMVTNSEAHPAFGTEIYDTVIVAAISETEPKQYLHVRAKCNSQFSFSDWTTKVLKDVPGGIADINNSVQPDIYPNPAREFVFVKNAQDAVLNITDFKGSIIRRISIPSNNEMIKIQDLCPGLYIMDFHFKNGGGYRYKLSKMY